MGLEVGQTEKLKSIFRFAAVMNCYQWGFCPSLRNTYKGVYGIDSEYKFSPPRSWRGIELGTFWSLAQCLKTTQPLGSIIIPIYDIFICYFIMDRFINKLTVNHSVTDSLKTAVLQKEYLHHPPNIQNGSNSKAFSQCVSVDVKTEFILCDLSQESFGEKITNCVYVY